MNKYIILLLALCFGLNNAHAQQSSWKTDNEGWVLRKEPGQNKYKRFFAVGIWNIPGYHKQAMDTKEGDFRSIGQKYLNKTDLYNIVFTIPGKNKDAHNRIEIGCSMPFFYALKEYQEKLPVHKEDNPYRQYVDRRYMQKHCNDQSFIDALDKTINDLIQKHGDVEHIWAPIDEIVQGGSGASWTWYPEIGQKIKERIKQEEPNTLIYTDLLGVARGNYYLFEKRYMKTHKSMPDNLPPFDVLGPDAKIMESHPTLGFFQSYNGKPVYENGTANYANFDLPTLKDVFYNNLKICAKDYKKCGDVFGLNAFMDCNAYPVLAGIAVDGIKAGVGENTPVWLYFDGNGYAQPSNEGTEAFVKNLKCQMYTSIIHGATGIMFWNDRSKPVDVFNSLETVVKEITNNIPIFILKTEKKQIDNDLHYMIKTDGSKRYLIASNTNKKVSVPLHVGNYDKILKPLEVIIVDL